MNTYQTALKSYPERPQRKILSPEQEEVPVIDFANFLNGSKVQQRKVALKVMTALEDYGQMILVNHGVKESMMTEVFDESNKFFSLSPEEKLQYSYNSHRANRGYLSAGTEKVHYGKEDIKETMEIGKEDEEGMPNFWPTEVPSFKQPMLNIFSKLDDLQIKILRCIEIGLDLPEGAIIDKCNAQHENLRLLHYPSVHSSTIDHSLKGTKRCADHTDYGTLTLLMQDKVGGLQLKLKNGDWIDVEPVEGGIIVQVADMLERWTNGLLPAARHRVVSPVYKRNFEGWLPERFSVAFFCNPNKDAIIDALPNTFEDGIKPKLYKPFNAMEYLTLRLRASL